MPVPLKLFLSGFVQVCLVAISTKLITQDRWLGVFGVSFLISWNWTFNVKKISIGSMSDRIFYCLGAAMGGVAGLGISKIVQA